MKRFAVLSLCISAAVSVVFAQQSARPQQPPPIKPTADEIGQIQAKTDELDGLIQKLRTKKNTADLLPDVEVYSKAGHMLLEFPEEFFTQDGITHALTVLDAGLDRARQLQNGHTPWTDQPKRIHGFY